MNIRVLSNGDLEMTADVIEREEIRDMLTDCQDVGMIGMESAFISTYLGDPMGNGKSYEQVAPEEIGALTSAPIISDGDDCYGYMDYQIRNFLDELAAGKSIIWKKG
jgi:hypothetical protein